MEWFNRYEYEQDKKAFWLKVLNKILDVIVLVIVVLGFLAWKFSKFIDREILKDISILKYILFALICIGIVVLAFIKGISEFVPWLMNNKKKAMRYLLWILVSTVVLFVFCAFLAKMITIANESSA